jgi:hypothetical protein
MLATSGRARLTYDTTGADGDADVLLIHAGVNDRRSWRHMIERLNRLTGVSHTRALSCGAAATGPCYATVAHRGRTPIGGAGRTDGPGGS